jgi:hypothetical protein
MGLAARRQDGKRAILLPRKNEAPAPSSAEPRRVTGEAVADALYRAVKGASDRGEELSLSCPTVTAYKVQERLLGALERGIEEQWLPSLLEDYLATHRIPQEDPWTGDEVPLYYLNVRSHGETVTGYTVNALQVRIISEIWKREAEAVEFSLTNL